MNISKTKFVMFFLISAFAFMFISNALFGSKARVFPWNEKSFLGTDSLIAWKSAGYKILYPVKIVLIGPLLPFVSYVRQDPDPLPPFVAAVFALYWTILAIVIHYLLGKIKLGRNKQEPFVEYDMYKVLAIVFLLSFPLRPANIGLVNS
ncbi:MAG: hypothetical protein Q7R35_02545 [Elusimicrobiota bacterium]|nr:hypothetical protein [Elusimicrobiota bacterium]